MWLCFLRAGLLSNLRPLTPTRSTNRLSRISRACTQGTPVHLQLHGRGCAHCCRSNLATRAEQGLHVPAAPLADEVHGVRVDVASQRELSWPAACNARVLPAHGYKLSTARLSLDSATSSSHTAAAGPAPEQGTPGVQCDSRAAARKAGSRPALRPAEPLKHSVAARRKCPAHLPHAGVVQHGRIFCSRA